MNLEEIMLSEISQRKTNNVWSLLHVESKKKILTDSENKSVVAVVWSDLRLEINGWTGFFVVFLQG